MTLLETWRNAWRGLGVSDPDEALFHQLVACYSEPHRRYHTLQHLSECLAGFETVRPFAEHPDEVTVALFFHDAIYQPRNRNNEAESARWASESVLASRLSDAVASRIHGLVMATKHDAVPVGRDAAVLVDTDLAILGAVPERFAEYERQVRDEYSWVPGPIYRRERRKILQAFAERPNIYRTETFRASHEKPARENISRSLAQLRLLKI